MTNDTQQNNPVSDSNTDIVKLETDLQDALNGWKRAAADFENYKRRREGENKELVDFAREVTVAKLLPTLDSLEQALRHIPEFKQSADQQISQSASEEFAKKYKNWQSGVNGIVIQLDKALEELGVKKIQAVGKKFDPHFHEAVKEVESDKPDGEVIDELQSGFELNGKLIRPSQVIISKKSAEGGK